MTEMHDIKANSGQYLPYGNGWNVWWHKGQ